MTTLDPFGTIHVRDDADYWDGLAARVAASAARVSKRTTFDWLAESRARWAVASVLLVAVLILTMRTSSASFPAEWTQVLAPSDKVGQTIILSGGPPAIGALLLSGEVGRAR